MARSHLVAILTIYIVASNAFEVPPANAKGGAGQASGSRPTVIESINSNKMDHEEVLSYTLEHSFADCQVPCDADFQIRQVISFDISALNRNFIELKPYSFTAQDTLSLQKLLEVNGFYRLRLVSNQNSKGGIPFVVASVPVCALVSSDFEEIITLNMDVYGNVIALDYQVPINNCHTDPTTQSSISLISPITNSKLKFSFGRSGERPHAGRPPPVAQTTEGADGDKTEKTFFQKYWMYIVPVGIMLLLQILCPTGPEASGGSGSGGSGSGGSS